MEIHPYQVRVNQRSVWVLWFSNDVDGVLLDMSGSILNFAHLKAAGAYLESNGFTCSQAAIAMLDLDRLQRDQSTGDRPIECSAVLNAWNFFNDVAASLPKQARDFLAKERAAGMIYDKLFWGNNLPAVTPQGEHYSPAWNQAERTQMDAIFISGIYLFESSLGALQIDTSTATSHTQTGGA